MVGLNQNNIMGVDTKMFVATKKENILKIMPVVLDTLNTWQRERLDNYWSRKGFDSRMQFLFRDESADELKKFSNGIRNCTTTDFGSFSVNFTVEGEQRSLFITHTCSGDYSEVYEGEKIIFSLGCWGLSDEIMKVLSKPLKEFGDVYYVYNDCADEFEKL